MSVIILAGGIVRHASLLVVWGAICGCEPRMHPIAVPKAGREPHQITRGYQRAQHYGQAREEGTALRSSVRFTSAAVSCCLKTVVAVVSISIVP